MSRGRGGRGGSSGQRRRDCIAYKFLGECEKHREGECDFRHEFVLGDTCREYVPVPEGMAVGMVIGSKGCNLGQLRNIAECYIDVKKDRALIIAKNQEKLQLLVAELKLIMSQESVSGPSWCLIHPQGVSSNCLYQFIPYRGRIPPRARTADLTMYEIHLLTHQGVCDDEEQADLVGRLAAMSPNTADDTGSGLRSSLLELHGVSHEGAEGLKWTQRTRIEPKPQEKIKICLGETLEVLHEIKKKSFVLRLNASFGKVNWHQFPSEVYGMKYTIESLMSDLLFAKESKHRNIFNTEVKPTYAGHIKHDDVHVHALEMLYMKVTAIEEGARLNVCLMVKRSDDGTPDLEVMMVKKNGTKNVTFDILNLHRQHDVRIGLHHYECVQDGDPLYAVVREIIGNISFPSQGKAWIQPKTTHWKIHLIRHKKKLTYILDDSFAITISDISEHRFNEEKGEYVEFDMTMDKAHVEMELHNLAWECAFGRDGGLSTDQSLALHIKKGAVDTRKFETIPYPWQPEFILKDFDTFWGHLDTLNAKLDGLNSK